MTQGRRPIRSRQQRSVEGSSPSSVDEVSAADAPHAEDGDVELRDLARSQGYRLVRDGRPARRERIPTCVHISVPVRRAMEATRYPLGLNFSEMVDLGVVMLLESRGIHVEGWVEG